ncbi:hypothetical protein AAHB61_26140 [Bacillus cereus]
MEYLDIHQADSLKECVKLYKEEERHDKILEGIGNLKKKCLPSAKKYPMLVIEYK